MMKQVALAAVLVAGFAAPAIAQDVEVLTVARRQDQGVHRFEAALKLDASHFPAGDEALFVQADVSDADRLDPDRVFRFRLWRSLDNGATWIATGAGEFRGHPENGPVMGVAITGARKYIGALIAVEMVRPSRMGLGFSLFTTRTIPGT